jgi:hypothetical protein
MCSRIYKFHRHARNTFRAGGALLFRFDRIGCMNSRTFVVPCFQMTKSKSDIEIGIVPSIYMLWFDIGICVATHHGTQSVDGSKVYRIVDIISTPGVDIGYYRCRFVTTQKQRVPGSDVKGWEADTTSCLLSSCNFNVRLGMYRPRPLSENTPISKGAADSEPA